MTISYYAVPPPSLLNFLSAQVQHSGEHSFDPAGPLGVPNSEGNRGAASSTLPSDFGPESPGPSEMVIPFQNHSRMTEVLLLLALPPQSRLSLCSGDAVNVFAPPDLSADWSIVNAWRIWKTAKLDRIPQLEVN